MECFLYKRNSRLTCFNMGFYRLLIQYTSIISNTQETRHFVRISECSKYRKLRKNQEFDNAVEFTTSENTVDIRCLELPRGQRKISRLNLMIYEYAVIQVAAK